MSGETGVNKQVRDLAMPKIMEALSRTKTAFMAQFGDYVETIHKEKLAEHFQKAGECKVKAALAKTQDEAGQYAEAAELHMQSIGTLAIGAKIVTKAKSASVIKETAAIILDTIGDVALVIIEAVASGVVSGLVGSLGGGKVAGGIADAASSFLG